MPMQFFRLSRQPRRVGWGSGELLVSLQPLSILTAFTTFHANAHLRGTLP